MRRRKQEPSIRLSAPSDQVIALTTVTKGHHVIPRGARVSRSHPMVRELPGEFLVSYRLDQERSEEVTDGE